MIWCHVIMLSNLRSSEAKYTSLDDESRREPHSLYRQVKNALFICWREVVILFLAIVCAILAFENVRSPLHNAANRAKVPEYVLRTPDTRWHQFQWHSGIYSSKDPSDEQAVDDAWDRIIPAHGIVAVDHEWASSHQLPATMNLPSDHSKGVYIIDAYHQLHCLTIIRKTFKELASNQVPTVPLGHSRHCFDSLLQYVVCGSPGDTLLYTWGRNETGDGQLRRCIDWESRMQWARDNTACYVDGDHPIPLNDHFGHCEGHEHDGIRLKT